MRNRYLDLLRAAAIVRVIVYHLYGWPWLSVLLPAMGVMFALAGSLTAASLDNRAGAKVVTSRLRRLLPPLWLLGLIAVPVMLVTGWAAETDGEHPFSVPNLLFWLVPIGDPPGSDLAVDAWEPLWYIRAYLWFVLLSPILYLLYRKAGWAAVALPLAIMAVLDVTGFTLPDTADAALWDFVTYGACWMAGFAHHDGRLARLKPWIAGPVALVLAAGAYYFMRDEGTYDLNDISEAQALWSFAFVLIALRWQPSMTWLAKVKPLDRTVTLINNRAVTIYLWHNIAIAAVWPVLTFLALDELGDSMGHVGDLLTAFLLTILAVLAFGWVEDLAAKRHPRLWPAGSTAHPAVGTVENPASPTAPVDPAPSAGPTDPGGHEPAPSQSRATRVSGTASAMANLGDSKRRQTAASAMHRLPANWPPIPRTEDPAPPATAATAGPAKATPQPEDPGFPVAGRRAGPLSGDTDTKPTLPAGWGTSEEPRQSGPEDATEWFRGHHARD
ncbi:acyltransferase family protein [Paractinoplanes atraurantiacus]|uniref:acyltransferase family protein n=1 Tax=Paractinoplanes atraurantiacus TaxID=1036182 RepID=UPI000BE2FF03|nr:acyltransferase [Actinoplanes atraurantiacus]